MSATPRKGGVTAKGAFRLPLVFLAGCTPRQESTDRGQFPNPFDVTADRPIVPIMIEEPPPRRLHPLILTIWLAATGSLIASALVVPFHN
jgi:hypothetical protein